MLKIPEGKRIKKPGVNKELKWELVNNYWQWYKQQVGEDQYMKTIGHQKKIGTRIKKTTDKAKNIYKSSKKDQRRLSSLSKKSKY